jgi:hypothetical protein
MIGGWKTHPKHDGLGPGFQALARVGPWGVWDMLAEEFEKYNSDVTLLMYMYIY